MEVKHGYKQAEIGVIPKDWDVKPLNRLAQIRSGIAKNSSASVTNPIHVHYLRVANVQDGFLDLTEMSWITINRDNLNRYAVLPGDVLMNEGGDLDQLGRGSIWHGEFNPCVHQNHVFVVRSSSALVPEYLNTWASSAAARRYFMVAGKQTTNLASINKTALGQLPVAVPNLKEQRAIAMALSDVDGLLSGLDRLIAKKRDLKQAVMQQLLTGQTRLPGFAGEWEVKTVGKLAGVSKGTQLHNGESSEDGAYPHFNGGISPSGFTHKSNTPGGTIAISEGGNSCGYVQFVEQPFWCGGHCYAVVPEGIDKTFLYHALKGVQSAIMGLRVGSGLPNVQKTSLAAFKVRVPMDRLEQTAIAEVLADMDAELTELEQRRAKTRALKQGMMQELLTGRTRLI
jgi:type I restriction enzyme, S subunit